MEWRAHDIVLEYIRRHLDKSDNVPNVGVYTVWKCKALQNWKFLISSSLLDGMYYELTFNGDKNEWYLDAYKKFDNQVIQESTADTLQTDIPKSTLQTDCTGCRFVGLYDTEFPCANCSRKTKDYYSAEQMDCPWK